MEQRLQLNTVTELPKKGEKVIILQLTDIQLHSNARPTKSIGEAVQRSIKSDKPGRIFSPLDKPSDSDIAQKSIPIHIPLGMEDPILKQAVHDYQQQGYRVMIALPKGGLPIYLGKDAIEFMQSTKGMRLLRRMKKTEGH